MGYKYSLIIILLIVLVCCNLKNSQHENFDSMDNVIMTTYFCKKKDPQRGNTAPCNDIKYIKPWYYSMKKLNLNGIVFHDGLSEKFIEKYKTDKIKFEYVNTKKFEYSVNDLRYFVYLDYLKRNTNIQNIFMTDGNDVTVVNSPFNKFEKTCVGQDADDNGNYIYTSHPYIKKQLTIFNSNKKWTYKFNENKNIKFYSAGILGGNRRQIVFFLENMVKIFNDMNQEQKRKNLNMVVFNYVIYHMLNEDVMSDAPLCSRFKKYENHRKDVCFIHK